MTETFEVRFLPADETVQVPVGTTLFTAAHWVGVAIDSTCGGVGTCGQCRVHIQNGRSESTSVDRQYLSSTELDDGWRLACMAQVRRDTTCLATEVREIPKTAISGDGQAVTVEPSVRKVYLELDPPTEEDTRSDLERLRGGVESEGLSFTASREILSELPSNLRQSSFAVTAALARQDLISVEAFRLVDDSAVNAFALPGGFVYMTRGILGHLDSEAELAMVMGHDP